MGEPRTQSAEYLAVGVLSFVSAVLSVVIHETTGEWPTDMGVWGVALFVLIGLLLLGGYARRRSGESSAN